MSHNIQKHDNYIYIKMTSPRFEFKGDSGFITDIQALQQENPNLIFNCKSIENISDEDTFKIKGLFEKNKSLAGHILVSELKEELVPKMELTGIICIPSDEEAVDYIFFEQIEQEFLKDFDGNDE